MRTWTTEDREYYEQHLCEAMAGLEAAADAIWTIVHTERLWEGTATPGHNEDEREALDDVRAEIEGESGGWHWTGEQRHDFAYDTLLLLLQGGAPCSACGECTVPARGGIELYTLRPDLARTVAPKDEALCIGCAEERLGRRLAAADFEDADKQLRWAVRQRWSARLRDRLGNAADAVGMSAP